MKKIKELYFNSYFSYLIGIIMTKFIPYLYNSFMNSFLVKAWKKFDKIIIQSKPVRFFFDTEFLSKIFYKSYFYRKATLIIRKISFHIPKASIKFDSYFIGFFLMIVLIIPDELWSDMFWMTIFGALSIFYISRNVRERTGTVFVLINTILFLFLLLLEIALPHNTITPLVYLFIGMDLFFLISFCVKSIDDLEKILKPLFISACILCGMAFIQNTLSATASTTVFNNNVIFGEILIIIFPFVFLYPMEYESGTRKWLYLGFLFIAFFNAIASTYSKAALIGFLIEVSIFMIADIKFTPFLFFMLPLGLGSIIENIKNTWHTTTTYGNPITNIITLFSKLWKFGFGVDSQKFLAFYNSTQFRTPAERTILSLPIKISPIYLNFIIDIGAIFIFAFLFYVLRIAHSTFTSIFVADKKYRRFFIAGLATLIGISVSSFFELNLFYSRILIVYWSMLGILRGIRIINMGIYEP